MNIIHVQLTLSHPHPKGNKDLEVSLIFNDQPNEAQVFEAFQEVPSVFHHEDFELYRRRLFDCLETYGVPKLDKFNMITPEGAPITVPMVYAVWFLNLISPTDASMGTRIGDIRISRRRVHDVTSTPSEPGTRKDEEPKADKAITAVRKTRLDPPRNTNKTRK